MNPKFKYITLSDGKIVQAMALVNEDGNQITSFGLLPLSTPSIVLGTPNLLTLDMISLEQYMYEPRESVGTLSIGIDFTIALANAAYGKLISMILSLSGAGNRIITLPSDFLVSIPSTIGVWAAPALTLTVGTDDIIEFQMIRYNTNSKWILKVSEVAV